ncbi:MAG: hypothetical protein SPK49_07125 [Erysipelotrichaceae bacterium]|nr:hypothetical protein [Erysipelotrichaceae bacterium]
MEYNDFLNTDISSIDFLLEERNINDPIFTYPIFVTPNYSQILELNPMFYSNGGFYLIRDKIIALGQTNKEQQPHLYLKYSSRFYNVYVEDKNCSFVYTFYSKSSFVKLYSYFSEEGEGVGGMELTKDGGVLCSKSEILGMACVEMNTSISHEAIFVLLLRSPRVTKTYRLFKALESNELITLPFESNNFKHHRTIVLAYSFLHDLKKYSSQVSKWIMINKKEYFGFSSFVENNYEHLDNEQKDECTFLYPELYKKLTCSVSAQQYLIVEHVVNLSNLIKEYGFDGLYRFMSILQDEKMFNLIKLVGKKVFNNKQIAITALGKKYQLPLILALFFINVQYPNQPTIKYPTGFWLYYLLYNIRKNSDAGELSFVNTLLAFTLLNNMPAFSNVMEFVKKQLCYIEIGGEYNYTSWNFKKNDTAVFELFYLFTNGCTSQRMYFSKAEQIIWNSSLENELECEKILNFLNGDVNHFYLGLPQQRDYYANALFEFIQESILSKKFDFREFY